MTTYYYTYILLCCDGTYYVGQTNNLELRLAKHNGEKKGGAKYTRTRRPVTLAYIETFADKSSAMKREYELKQLTHQEKEALCKDYKISV